MWHQHTNDINSSFCCRDTWLPFGFCLESCWCPRLGNAVTFMRVHVKSCKVIGLFLTDFSWRSYGRVSSKFFPGTGQRAHWVYCYMARHVTFLPMAAWCRCHVGLSKSLLPRGCRTTVIPHVLICGVQTFLTLAPQQNLHEVDRSVFLRPPFFWPWLRKVQGPPDALQSK